MLVRTIPPFILVFLTVIYRVSCQGASLTFVIDDTWSMHDDIAQVRNEVDSIMDIVLDKQSTPVSNIVLVTFNDPANPILRNTTRNRYDLKRALDDVYVHGGGDCPERALAGIKLALESSLPGSYIYVFTDASAKDYWMSEEIQQLCQRKQSQIVFVLTGDCYHPELPNFQVYYELTTASSGLAIRVPKSEVQTIVRQFLEEDIKGNKTGLTTQLTPAYVETRVPFWIDELTKYAIVSASGSNVYLNVLNDGHLEWKKVIWTDHAKVIKLKGTKYGEYGVSVRSSSPTSVVVTGRSDFYFRHGFSDRQPKSLDETAPQPISETLTRLSLLVTDPQDSVRIQTAQILDMKENVIKEMSLEELWPNFYTTESFAAPSHMFKVALTGKVIKTGQPVRRLAKIPITPQKAPLGTVPKAPVVEIKEGASVEVALGAALTLTCKVSAYPAPEITWRNDKGFRIQSDTSTVQIPYDYVSYLKISSASEGRYYCHARNNLGKKQFKSIDVIIRDPFIINTVPTGTTKIAYGTASTLNCDVRSHRPLQIRWYHENKHTGETEHVLSSEKYSISKDGTQLKIISMDVDLTGRYTCKVFLQKDPTQNKDFSTTVEITGLAAPKIDSNLQTIKVKEHMPATIKCKILESVPKPKISWQMKAAGSTEYRSIAGSDTELRIKQAGLADGGHYKCVAENVEGHREGVVAELVVLKAPAVTIVEGTSKVVPYGSQLTLACRVTANPEPTVIWRDSAWNTLPATSSIRKSVFEYTHTIARVTVKRSEKYSCSASNDQGSASNSIQVTVSSPFQVHSHPPESISVKYGNAVNLKCQITSNFPMKIRWYHKKDMSSEKKEIESSKLVMVLSNGAELNINAMDVGLDGEYSCRASLIEDPDEHVEHKTQVKLYGLEVPSVTGINFQTVTAGAAVSVKCIVIKGVPIPKLRWQFRSKRNGKFVDIANTGNEWHTAKVTAEHSGYYKCIATNNQGTDEHVVQLIVQVPARIITEEFQYLGMTGDISLRVPCDTIGYPKPVVEWDVNGTLVIPGNKYAIEDDALIIKNPTMSDNDASYTCTASNIVGSDFKQYEIVVNNTLNDYGVIHDIYLLKDESTTLKCNLPRLSSSQFKWFKNGKEVKNDEPYINIKNAHRINDDGDYTCHVTDVHGSASETFAVDVGYPPRFKYPQKTHEIEWSKEPGDYLRCNVYAKPAVKVEWTLNGEVDLLPNKQPVEWTLNGEVYLLPNKQPVSVTSEELEITDWGHYKCNVSNVHGAVQREFDVIRP